MDKFTPQSPCPYHGLLKPGAKYTNVIYNSKAGGHAAQKRHLQFQQLQQQQLQQQQLQQQQLQQQQLQHQYRMGGNGAPGAGDAPKAMEPIWDIVSGLAQALNDAKDQLATLMQPRGTSPLKNRFSKANNGNGNGNGTTCIPSHGQHKAPPNPNPRCSSAPHRRPGPAHRAGTDEDSNDQDPYTRNIHRSHAHGYYAFGHSTEFKERMHHSGSGRAVSSPGRGRGRGMEGGGGQYGIRLQGGTGACGIKVIPNGKSYMCTRDRGRTGLHLQAKMRNCNMNVDSDGEKFGPSNPMKIRFSAPSKVRYPLPYRQQQQPPPSVEVRRYCVGTQYANLLREEAFHLREKRIREGSKIMKSHH